MDILRLMLIILFFYKAINMIIKGYFFFSEDSCTPVYYAVLGQCSNAVASAPKKITRQNIACIFI